MTGSSLYSAAGRYAAAACLITALLSPVPSSSKAEEAGPPPVRIGIVIDGNTEQDSPHLLQVRELLIETIAREIRTLTSREFDVRFPTEKRLSGN